MSDREHLTVGEFERGLDLLGQNINAGFAGVHARLDRVEHKVDGHAEAIAVLNDRQETAGRRASWHGAGVASVAVGVIEIIKAWFWPDK